MKDIYIIRHGQTEFNRRHIVQGSGVDAALNAVGHAQAEAFFKEYREIAFSKVYTSKLKRTHQTVASFIANGVAWEQLEGLNEISWGVKEGRRLTPEDDEQHFAMLKAWKSGDYSVKVPQGESPQEVVDRQKIAWAHIMEQSDENPILVCMHGRAMRILLCYLLDVPMSQMDDFEHTNTCLYLLRYDEATAKYTAIEQNNTKHLDNIDWQSVEVAHVPVN